MNVVAPLRRDRWMTRVLQFAAFYNLAWAAWVVLFPQALFSLSGLEAPNFPAIWQCLGMVIGVYGIGYWLASRDPLRHWPIVLVGLLGKVLGPIGLVWAATRGELPWNWAWLILTNDVAWWLPFAAILYFSWRDHGDRSSPENFSWKEALHEVRSQRGATLDELSRTEPLMVVFLRHSGCAFCRECLADLADVRPRLRAARVQLALVHMNTPMGATQLLDRYGLDDVHHFSDPRRLLYKAFDLKRGTLAQLFGVRGWTRAVRAFVQHGCGPIRGDVLQLPGVFLLRNGVVVRQHRHAGAYERPDYWRIATGACDVRANDASIGKISMTRTNS